MPTSLIIVVFFVISWGVIPRKPGLERDSGKIMIQENFDKRDNL
jgi:hypothetical protein